eukprot:2624629-Amphidinium_carterae.1
MLGGVNRWDLDSHEDVFGLHCSLMRRSPMVDHVANLHVCPSLWTPECLRTGGTVISKGEMSTIAACFQHVWLRERESETLKGFRKKIDSKENGSLQFRHMSYLQGKVDACKLFQAIL